MDAKTKPKKESEEETNDHGELLAIAQDPDYKARFLKLLDKFEAGGLNAIFGLGKSEHPAPRNELAEVVAELYGEVVRARSEKWDEERVRSIRGRLGLPPTP